jgi:energy-coupling factor transporter transmembrane protein EcfT
LAGLHPLAKLISAAILLVGVLSPVRAQGLFPVSLPILVGLTLAGSPMLRYFAGLRHLAFFFAVVLAWPIATLGWSSGAAAGAVSAFRILLVYSVGYLLVQNADRWELARVLDRLFAPLSRLSRITLLLVLTLELFPLFTQIGFRLHRILASRGTPGRWKAIRRLPLFLESCLARCLHRGEKLEFALRARHFRGTLGPRGQWNRTPWRKADSLCISVSAVCAATSILSRFKG